MVIVFSVSTLRDSLGFAAESRHDSTKNPFKPTRRVQSSHNTEHQVRLDFLVYTHSQVARTEFVLETAIHPFNRSSLSIALNCRMDKTGSVRRFAFSCQRFLQALVASRVRVDNADTVMFS